MADDDDVAMAQGSVAMALRAVLIMILARKLRAQRATGAWLQRLNRLASKIDDYGVGAGLGELTGSSFFAAPGAPDAALASAFVALIT